MLNQFNPSLDKVKALCACWLFLLSAASFASVHSYLGRSIQQVALCYSLNVLLRVQHTGSINQ
jgi:hypothetical protein